MKKTHPFLLLLLAGLMTMPSTVTARRKKKHSSRRASTKYVNAPTAQLKQDKTATAPIVAEIKRGDKLKVLEKGDGRWLKVALARSPKTTGWIYFNKITDTKPKDTTSKLAFHGGITSSDLETGGAIRGLKKASQAYATKKKITPQTVADMHRIQTFPLTLKEFDKNNNGNLEPSELQAANEKRRQWIEQNLAQFLKEGKLGEYAE